MIITEDDLITAINKINPNKAAGMNGIPGAVIRLIAERRTEKLLGVLNAVNRRRKLR
jgi:hypothetical protein